MSLINPSSMVWRISKWTSCCAKTRYHSPSTGPILFADREEVKRMLDEQVSKGIITPVAEPTDLASLLVVTRKPRLESGFV